MTSLNPSIELYQHQSDIIDWCQDRQYGIVAAEMGLGKTISILTYMAEQDVDVFNGQGRFLYLCPTSLLDQVYNETLKTLKTPPGWRTAFIHHGSSRHSTYAHFGNKIKILISTYQTFLNDWQNNKIKTQFNIVIIDEIHNLRNHKSVKHVQMADFIQSLPEAYRFGLTGTPYINSYHDMINQVSMLCSEGELSSTEKLLDNFHFVRKCDVLTSLPPLKNRKYTLKLGARERRLTLAVSRDLSQYLNKVLNSSRKLNFSQILAKINYLIKITSYFTKSDETDIQSYIKHGPSSKIKATVKLLSKIPADDKVIIFTRFTTTLNATRYFLQEADHSVSVYHGGLDSNARKDELFKFRAGETKVFLCTIQSASVGLNLQVANHVIFVDQWWNSSIQRQAIDRCHRLGQEKPVFVHNLFVADSIDRWIYDLKKTKDNMQDIVLSGKDFSFKSLGKQMKLGKGQLTELLHKILQPSLDSLSSEDVCGLHDLDLFNMLLEVKNTPPELIDPTLTLKILENIKSRPVDDPYIVKLFPPGRYYDTNDKDDEECPICNDVYGKLSVDSDNVAHRISLDCGHTSCVNCVYAMVENQPENNIQCPVCRNTKTIASIVEKETCFRLIAEIS